MSGLAANRALRDRIAYWVGQGYRVTVETPTSAQLVRPRKFNPAEFIAMPIYVVEYLGQRDRTVYLSVADDGTIAETGSALEMSRYRRAQDAPAWRRLLNVIVGFAVIVGILWLLPQIFR